MQKYIWNLLQQHRKHRTVVSEVWKMTLTGTKMMNENTVSFIYNARDVSVCLLWFVFSYLQLGWVHTKRFKCWSESIMTFCLSTVPLLNSCRYSHAIVTVFSHCPLISLHSNFTYYQRIWYMLVHIGISAGDRYYPGV